VKVGGTAGFAPLASGLLQEGLHSQEAWEAVDEHLTRSLAPVLCAGVPPGQLLRMPLLTAGQAYATSALFGYVLRRAEQRLRLERLMQPGRGRGEGSLQAYIEAAGPGDFQDTMSTEEAQEAAEAQVAALFGDLRALKARLQEQLARVAPGGAYGDQGECLRLAVERGEVASLSLRADQLRRIILEGVAFGALLHEAEAEAQEFYELTPAAASGLGNFGVDMDGRGNPVLPN